MPNVSNKVPHIKTVRLYSFCLPKWRKFVVVTSLACAGSVNVLNKYCE